MPQIPAYATRMCPLMTAGTFKRDEPSRLAGVAQKPPTAEGIPVMCAGPKCAWFVSAQDDKGNVVDGACAIAAQFQGLQQIASLMVNGAPSSDAEPSTH